MQSNPDEVLIKSLDTLGYVGISCYQKTQLNDVRKGVSRLLDPLLSNRKDMFM